MYEAISFRKFEVVIATSVLATALGLHGEYKPEEQPLFTGSLSQSQKDAIAANKEVLPDLISMAGDINSANTDELLKMLNKMIPGYSQNLAIGVGNANALMRGELPADVQRNIADWAAQRGISSGTIGSQFSDATELWKYGISTLEGQQRGLNQFLEISARSPKAPLYDFTSMFITPAQHFNSELQKYQVNLPVQLYNEWARNQPGNLERATGQLLDWVATEGTSVMNMYTGNMMGGMGGMGGGMGGGAEASTGFGGPGGFAQGAGEGTGEGGSMDFGPDYFSKSPYFG